MSTMFSMFPSLPPTYLPELRRDFWARTFGFGIREARKKVGLSIEAAARLAGIEASEWAAIEDGYVPQETNRLRAMAGALEISYDQLLNLVLLCREAWEL